MQGIKGKRFFLYIYVSHTVGLNVMIWVLFFLASAVDMRWSYFESKHVLPAHEWVLVYSLTVFTTPLTSKRLGLYSTNGGSRSDFNVSSPRTFLSCYFGTKNWRSSLRYHFEVRLYCFQMTAFSSLLNPELLGVLQWFFYIHKRAANSSSRNRSLKIIHTDSVQH